MKTIREHSRFDAALRQVLSVSKEELMRREKEYKEERAEKPKRGPKPKYFSSDLVFVDTENCDKD